MKNMDVKMNNMRETIRGNTPLICTLVRKYSWAENNMTWVWHLWASKMIRVAGMYAQ